MNAVKCDRHALRQSSGSQILLRPEGSRKQRRVATVTQLRSPASL
jgi:hypothetical protein